MNDNQIIFEIYNKNNLLDGKLHTTHLLRQPLHDSTFKLTWPKVYPVKNLSIISHRNHRDEMMTDSEGVYTLGDLYRH